MPLHSERPEHAGERSVAQHLLGLDDGKLHLWFNLALPGSAEIDLFLWDEVTGPFCVEIKAVPAESIQRITLERLVVAGRNSSHNPVYQSRRATFGLVDFLRGEGLNKVPIIQGTACWPKITRSNWLQLPVTQALPKAYEEKMLFAEDFRSLESLRNRLAHLVQNPPWGLPHRPYHHNEDQLREAQRILTSDQWTKETSGQMRPDPSDSKHNLSISIATAGQAPRTKQVLETIPQVHYRDPLDLGTEWVIQVGRDLLATAEKMSPLMPQGWKWSRSPGVTDIIARLNRPFKLGVCGEFRSGKSSLINALIGYPLALVREVETTFVRCRFHYEDRPCARVGRSDGSWTATTVETANDQLLKALSGKVDNIAQVDFGCPAPILKQVELWDAPGLGGTDQNDQIARSFAQEIDAAIWVFNADYIGRSSLMAVLEELTARNKIIIGVVNKAEELDIDEMKHIETHLHQVYAGTQFTNILPVSARLGLVPDGRWPEDEGWAVGGDGNIDNLLEVIRDTILADPQRIMNRSAAGDIRAAANALREEVGDFIQDLRRRLRLGSALSSRAEQVLQKRIPQITSRLQERLWLSLEDRWVEKTEERIYSLGGKDLEVPERVSRICHEFVEQGGVEKIFQECFDIERKSLEHMLNELGFELQQNFFSAFTPAERQRWMVKVPEGKFQGMQLIPDVESAYENAVTSALVLGGLALLIPMPLFPLVIVGAIVAIPFAFIFSLFCASKPTSLEELRKIRLKEARESIRSAMEQLKPRLNQAVADSIHSIENELRTRVHLAIRELIEVEPPTTQKRLQDLETIQQQVDSLLIILAHQSPGMPIGLDGALNESEFPLGAVESVRKTIQLVFGRIQQEVFLVDSRFSAHDMPLLLDVPSAASIKLLAWAEPLSSCGESFAIALAQLRAKRDGGVHVVSPLKEASDSLLPFAEGPVPELPRGTWIFVPGWAFHFDCALGEVYSASRRVKFTPMRDDGSLVEHHALRWWQDRVEGFQAIRIGSPMLPAKLPAQIDKGAE